MPRAEVRETTDSYAKLDYAWEAYQPVIASLTQCTTYFSLTPDISTLSPATVADEIGFIKQTMAREAVYGLTLSGVGRQPGFRPVPRVVRQHSYRCRASVCGYRFICSIDTRLAPGGLNEIFLMLLFFTRTMIVPSWRTVK
jgi:hypothetical protein